MVMQASKRDLVQGLLLGAGLASAAAFEDRMTLVEEAA